MIFLIKNLIYALLLVCLAAQVGRADSVAEAAAAPTANILIVGDSLSAAYNMETRDAWPSLLQVRLNQDGYAWRVFNSSIVGDTTQGGLARLPRLLERHRPAIVVLELGGNDGLRGLPPEVTRDNLSKMIRMAQADDARVILTGIRIPPNYGPEYIIKFEGIYPELSAAYGTALVPFFMDGVALQPGLMQADGVHPSVEAQPILLDNLWQVLQPMLQH